MKKRITILVASMFFSIILVSNSYAQTVKAKSKNKTNNTKPKLCDCQNSFYKGVRDAMDYGITEPSAFSKKCEKYYTVEEIIDAECGLTNYDPNFKAK